MRNKIADFPPFYEDSPCSCDYNCFFFPYQPRLWSHNPISVIWWWSKCFPCTSFNLGIPGGCTPHLYPACSSSPLICSRFMGGLAVWSGRRLLLFHPLGSRAAKEPFTFHQALAPGGRAAQATGMNQWMPCRPQGARPCKHGGGKDVGRLLIGQLTSLPRWARLKSRAQGVVSPPAPLPASLSAPALWLAKAGEGSGRSLCRQLAPAGKGN